MSVTEESIIIDGINDIISGKVNASLRSQMGGHPQTSYADRVSFENLTNYSPMSIFTDQI
jgi:hypothetical protein